MIDYKTMYTNMFNAVTDALEKLEKDEITSAMILLAGAQCKCEELYLSSEE